ncbi:MAG: PIN domain-containing protein [Candidatus Limnocylindrales bacterium]
MSERTFIDTNIWVYVVDRADARKQAVARGVLEPSVDKDFVISAQVLGEFFTVVTGKLAHTVSIEDGRAMVSRMVELPVVPIDAQLVTDAIAAAEQWAISYWDALIVAAARVAGCRVLLSEDLTHGVVYGSIRVENPFLAGDPGAAPRDAPAEDAR